MLLLSCQMRKDWQSATENDSKLIPSNNIKADSSIRCLLSPPHLKCLLHADWDEFPVEDLNFKLPKYFINDECFSRH